MLYTNGKQSPGDEEVQWVEACLQVVEWAACWGQRVDVQKVVVAGVPSSYQKEVAVASEVVAGLVTQGSGQAQAKGPGTEIGLLFRREPVLPAPPTPASTPEMRRSTIACLLYMIRCSSEAPPTLVHHTRPSRRGPHPPTAHVMVTSGEQQVQRPALVPVAQYAEGKDQLFNLTCEALNSGTMGCALV
ncbi:hypothetical protein EYF80_023357 [Liparis tanakae]|uniref:Uncharacterized protein n=1 Tax=Liparis tanakae TaxID=230148 RepID=A0A4Z2HKN5_9TELE|nr:hypothetical protein EYF80_023357 [Liparis tanakae]